jgi:hypothetical protein
VCVLQQEGEMIFIKKKTKVIPICVSIFFNFSPKSKEKDKISADYL